MATKTYRLGEYKIMASDTGELTWEAHSGFAEFQEGRCFRKGTILFVAQGENDQMGFLKGDFLDHIKGLPEWRKTRYCCSAAGIYHCRTGKRVGHEEMLMWMLGRGRGQVGTASREGTFRLGRYEIARNATGRITWKTASGANAVTGGTAVILEDVLFLQGREKTESYLIGRRFAEDLKKLPKWDQTTYYCPSSSLSYCEPENGVPEDPRVRPRARAGTARTAPAGKVGRRIHLNDTGPGTWKRLAPVVLRRASDDFGCAAHGLWRIVSSSFAAMVRISKQMIHPWRLKKGRRSLGPDP